MIRNIFHISSFGNKSGKVGFCYFTNYFSALLLIFFIIFPRKPYIMIVICFVHLYAGRSVVFCFNFLPNWNRLDMLYSRLQQQNCQSFFIRAVMMDILPVSQYYSCSHRLLKLTKCLHLANVFFNPKFLDMCMTNALNNENTRDLANSSIAEGLE